MFHFLHSSDLHLGKPFGRFGEDVRGRLREARFAALERLAQAARAGGAGTVLLAGDTFDQETPAPRLIRQTLNAMRAAEDIRWIVMPGNHDSLAATELWRTLAGDKPDNVTLALTPAPLELGGAHLLPAPCTTRNPGRDLTDAMTQPTPEGSPRIGLGHGGITRFTAAEDTPDGPSGVIPPDRAARSGLDYLGLGDWHGQIRIDARSWYSGTPEADSFKHPQGAQALLVGLPGPQAPPEVTPVAPGAVTWRHAAVALAPDEDIDALMADVLPPVAARRDCMLSLGGQGRLGIAQMQALRAALSRVAPDFLHAEWDLAAVDLVQVAADLQAIDASGGALRQSAERLAAMGADAALSQAERKTALDALSYLFGFAATQGAE